MRPLLFPTPTLLTKISTSYKLALKTGFYEFQAARDTYREATASVGMHKDLVLSWIKMQALMLNPITPHWSEYIWQELLKNSDTIQKELFPSPTGPVSASLTAASHYVQTVASSVTSTEAAQLKRKAKGKAAGGYDPKKPKKLTVYVALSYPAWQEKYIDLVREAFDATTLSINDKELNPAVSKLGEMKKAMPFVQVLKKRLTQEAPDAVFNRKLAFDEVYALKQVVPTLKKTTGCKEIEIVVVDEGAKTGKKVEESGETPVEVQSPIAEGAEPGNPKFEFANIE